MYWEDYYGEEAKYPEVEELLEDTTNKIVNIIKDDVKEEINKSLLLAEQRSIEIDNLRKTIAKKNDEIHKLDSEIETLKKRQTKLSLPFEIGEEIWVAEYTSSYQLTCNTCKGTGRVTVGTQQYGEVQISCPHCKGFTLSNQPKREVTYYKYTTYKTSVKSIDCNITCNGISYNIHYTDKYHNDQVRELEKCFSNENDCITFCEEYNKQCYEQALKSLEGEEGKKE